METQPSPLAEVSSPTPPAPLDHPETLGPQILWSYAIAFTILHLLACLALAPWFFSWTGLLLVPLGNYLFGSIGINLGYHRLLTHRGLKTPKWFEYTTALLGMCSLQETPARWVATHRLHHQHSDERPDPHSPLVSFLWGHFKWLLVENRQLNNADFYDKYARDLLRDPFYLFFERNLWWLWVYVLHAGLIFLIGFAVGWVWNEEGLDPLTSGLRFGGSLFVWGVAVRTVYVWHITWSVNSLAHLWGYRNYPTADNSRNNWLVALVTNGEGWHNNHHADPRAASHGHTTWELDVTYWTICLLEWIGLATEVVRPRGSLAPESK